VSGTAPVRQPYQDLARYVGVAKSGRDVGVRQAPVAEPGPEIPATTVLDNPYTYTEWDAGSAQWKGGGRGDGPG
jgi:hypothetical protein